MKVTFKRPCECSGLGSCGEVSSYISLDSFDDDIKELFHPDEIVIPMKEIRIEYTYPLTNNVIMFFEADNETNFTRAELARKICEGYQKIYEEDEADPYAFCSAEQSAHGFDCRIPSEGPYGIWGDDIKDLILSKVIQIEGNLFGLSVDS